MRITALLIIALAFIFSPTFSVLAGPEPLTVVHMSPQGMVDNLSQITIRFSQDMRPLGAMEQDAAGAPARIIPSEEGATLPPGNWRWLDPATLAYLFNTPLTGSANFTVLVPAGAKALSGATLYEEISWDIETPAIDISLADSNLSPQNATITLKANQELNPESLRAACALFINRQPASFTLEPGPNFSGNTNQRVFLYTLSIKRTLPPDARVSLQIARGLKARNGFIASAQPFEFNLKSFSRLTLDKWSVSGQREGRAADPEAPLNLYFNNPVKYNDIIKHITISPEAKIDHTHSGAGYSQHHALTIAWQPHNKYQITIKPGLSDSYGTTLAEPVVLQVNIGSYAPFIRINTGSKIAEAGLGGIFPIVARNISPMDIFVRLLPWDSQAFNLLTGYRYSRNDIDKLFERADKRLNFARQADTIINYGLSLEDTLRANPMGGLVALAIKYQNLNSKKQNQQQSGYAYLQVTDLGLSCKLGQDKGLAWVTSLASGQPLSQVDITVYNLQAKALWQGKTDENGLCRLPGAREIAKDSAPFIMASLGRDKVVLPLDWSGDLFSHMGRIAWPMQKQLHVITPLPLYQPGQRVDFMAYLRISTPEGWQAHAAQKVNFFIRDSRGEKVYEQSGVTDAYGSIAGQFTLAEDASLGAYHLAVEGLAQGAAFQVASFRAPDFRVDISAPPNGPLGDVPLKSVLSADYFFGAPLTGAGAELIVKQTSAFFAPDALKGYQVGASDGWQRPYYPGDWHGGDPSPKVLGTLNAVLDNRGKAYFNLPNPRITPGKSLNIDMEATVKDPAGLASQGAASFMVHASSYFVGIKNPYIARINEAFSLHMKAATFDNKPLANVPVTVTATRLHSENAPFTQKQSFVINNPNGQEFKFKLAESGSYEITASIKDRAGRENISVSRIYIIGPDMLWRSGYQDRHLELVSDSQEYQPGDTAAILIKNPLSSPGMALITVEQAGILEHFVRPLNEPAPVIRIPITNEHVPYVYVSALVIKGRSAHPPVNGDDPGAPAVFRGSLLLNIADPTPPLTVSVKTSRDQFRPADKVEVSVKAGQQCQVTLLAVDKRILRAAGDAANHNPALSFKPVIWQGVATADVRTRLLDLSAYQAGEAEPFMAESAPSAPAPPMAARARQASNAMESGAEGEQAALEARQNFSPVALWLAQVETDAKGNFNSAFTLPDTLTAYEVVAVAADKGQRFAHAAREITVNKPLQITSSLPRFITQGDKFAAAFLAHNLSAYAGALNLEIKVNGVELVSPPKQSLRLAAGQSAPFAYTIKAINPGTAEISITASLGQEKDTVKYSLPVLPNLPLTTVAAAGMLSPGQQYSLPVEIPADVDKRSLLQVILAPSPAAGLPLTAQALLDYPWDCLEQSLSKAGLRIFRLLHGHELGLPSAKDDLEKAQAIFNRIARFQQNDGGFALWPGFSEADFYLTGFAMLMELKGREAGLTLNPQVTQKALAYLARQLNRQLSEESERNVALDARAFAAWVLAAHKQSEAGRFIAELMKEARQMNPMGLACLMLAHHELKLAQPAELITLLEKTASITPTQMHFAAPAPQYFWFSMGSNLRDNALTLMALSANRPDYPRLEALALWVSINLGEKTYLSTQESIFGIWGLGVYLRSLGGEEPVEVKARWNMDEKMTAKFQTLVDDPSVWRLGHERLVPGASQLHLESLSGRPYWTARLSYASMERQEALNAGFTIERKWLTPGPWKMGQVVEAEISLTAPAIRRHVLLFDPFPAGMEPLYATRPDLAERHSLRQAPWRWQEMRADGLLLYTPRMGPGTYKYRYQLRAFVPGVFIKRPSQVEEMYTPEVFGRTKAEATEVKP